MKLTTSTNGQDKGDIRLFVMNDKPFKYKDCFLGIHVDISMRQLIIYFGLCHFFIEIFPPERPWGATRDYVRPLGKWKGWLLQKHFTNHTPHDYFFNIGVTFDRKAITFFLWKLQLWRKL